MYAKSSNWKVRPFLEFTSVQKKHCAKLDKTLCILPSQPGTFSSVHHPADSRQSPWGKVVQVLSLSPGPKVWRVPGYCVCIKARWNSETCETCVSLQAQCLQLLEGQRLELRASTISSSLLAIQFTLLPAMAAQGAKTSSNIERSLSWYSLQHVLMSAYTESSGLRLKQRASMFFSFRSNHKWMLITGIPSKLSSCQKNGIVDHAAGMSRLNTSTGKADTYSSAWRISPPRSRRCLTAVVAFVSSNTISSTIAPNRTSPPLASICSFMGLHKRSGWFPSKKAVWLPSVSLMKRFMAVNTTVMESLSVSMKSSAFAMGMKTSSMIRSGIPYFRQNSVTEDSSWASIKLCPSISVGSRGGPVWSFLS